MVSSFHNHMKTAPPEYWANLDSDQQLAAMVGYALIIFLLTLNLRIAYLNEPRSRFRLLPYIILAGGIIYSFWLTDRSGGFMVSIVDTPTRRTFYYAFAVLQSISAPVAWFISPAISKRIDFRQAWGLAIVSVIAFAGFGVVQENWLEPTGAFSFMNDSRPIWETVEIRGLRYTVSNFDAWANDLGIPLLHLLYSGAILMIVSGISAVILKAVRRNPGWAFPIAIGVYALVGQPSITESMIGFFSSVWLGARFEKRMAAPRKSHSVWRRLAISITVAAILAFLASYLLIKVIILTSLRRWDVIFLYYVLWGFIIGRLWNYSIAISNAEARSHFSIDEYLIARSRTRSLRPLTRLRIDTLIFCLPYFTFVPILMVAGYARGWSIGPLVFNVGMAVIGIAVVLSVLRVKADYSATGKAQAFPAVHREIMGMVSRLTHRVGAVDVPSIVFLIVLPIVPPFFVGALLGFRSVWAIGSALIVATGGLLLGARLLSWLHSRPPSVVVLGSSTAACIHLQGKIARAIAPLRAVSLLAIEDIELESKSLPPSRDCLRTIWNDGWHQIVEELCRMAPLIIIDSRRITEPTLRELRLLIDQGWLSKTIVTNESDGSSPLLEAMNLNPTEPAIDCVHPAEIVHAVWKKFPSLARTPRLVCTKPR